MLLGLPEFDLLATDTVDETCSMLSHYGRDARVLAGGTDLLVKMKYKVMLPRYLINIKRVPGLVRIHHDAENGLRIGASTTIEAIKDSPVITQKFPLLNQAAGRFATLQIRNLGTLGGNLANASPAAEFAPPLITLDASVQCSGSGGERRIPIEEFFLGPGRCALHEDEMITDVLVPNPASGAVGIYLKHSLRRMDVAVVSAAVLVRFDGGACRDVKIALGAVAPTPIRARNAEVVLKGQKLQRNGRDDELLEEVAQAAASEALPIDDLRAYARYRRHVVGMLVKQGLEEAIAQARP